MKAIQVPKHLNKFGFHHKNGTFKQVYSRTDIRQNTFHIVFSSGERNHKEKKNTRFLVVFPASINENTEEEVKKEEEEEQQQQRRTNEREKNKIAHVHNPYNRQM